MICPSKNMSPCGLFNSLSSVCFEAKIQFSLSRDLSFARNRCSVLPETTECKGNIWSLKAPDFSLRLYKSTSDPPKKQRGAIRQPSKTKKKTKISLPRVLPVSHKRTDAPKFVTSYRPPDALQAELLFVKTGKYPPEPYKNPKPHAFRPLDEDVPDIITTYEKDPRNLMFKLKNLDIVPSTPSDTPFGLRDTKTRMNTFKSPESKWDSRLILPLLPWPPQSASYTRHRRRREAYNAFLDRVEEKLYGKLK